MEEYPHFCQSIWKRPDHIAPYPYVWSRFTVENSDGLTHRIRIQDMTPDQREEVWDMYEKYFFPEDEIYRLADMIGDEVSMKTQRWLFNRCVQENLSIVAVLDNADANRLVLLGGLKLVISCKDNSQRLKLPGEARVKICNLFDSLYGDVDLFERLKINRCLREAGLVVKPEYRRWGIATELFKAMELMGKTFEIPAAVISLSNPRSQALAAKLNYSILNEMKLSDYVNENGQMILQLPEQMRDNDYVIQRCYKILSCNI